MKVGVKNWRGGECGKRNQFNNYAICRTDCQYGIVDSAHDFTPRGSGFELYCLQIFKVEKIVKIHFVEKSFICAERQTDKDTDRQTDRKTDRQTDRQTNRQTNILNRVVKTCRSANL